VLAAGTAGADNDAPLMTRRRGKVGDLYRMYPASYGFPHIVSVAASDHNDEYASSTWCEQNGSPEWRCLFTSWGAESVDLAAPGADVLSTVPDARYMPLDGTSMATPHVAGVAGLVKSQHPHYSATDMKNAIMNSVDRPAGLETLERFRSGPEHGSFTRTNGRLNALNALEADTGEATEPTDGTVEGASWINHTRRGSIRWPEDPMDVFRRHLGKARYRVRLEVPAGRDYRLLAWAPGIKEIWQIEGGCFAFLWAPGVGGDGCKLVAWSDRRVSGRDEVITFKARQNGVHYFLVNPWLKSEGNYRIRIVGVRSISVTAARSRVPRGRRIPISGRIGHPDCLASQRVLLGSRVPGRRFRIVARTWTNLDGTYAFPRVRIRRTMDYRTVTPRTEACTQATSRAIRIRAI
jgi:hypothetical protein